MTATSKRDIIGPLIVTHDENNEEIKTPSAVNAQLPQHIHRCSVFDVANRPHKLESLYQKHKYTVVVFLRVRLFLSRINFRQTLLQNFLDYITIDYAKDWAKVDQRALKEVMLNAHIYCLQGPLQRHNTGLIFIGCGEPQHIAEFKALTGLSSVYVDPERILYTNFNFREGNYPLDNGPSE